MTLKGSPGPHPGNTACGEAVKLIRKKRYHVNTRVSLSLSVAPLSVVSSSPLRCPDRKPPLTSRRLCFCLDLRIEFFRGPRHQIWNRNCCLISLEAGQGVEGANYLPSITPLCSLFSSERITSFTPPPPPLPPSLPVPPPLCCSRSTLIQTYRNT